jgi:hypothetical protein
MIVKNSVSKFKYNLDSDLESSRQIATSGGHEIIGIMLTAQGGSASALICDSKNGMGLDNENIPISANAGESTVFTPAQPIGMNKGIYLVIETGKTFGASLFILYN